MMLNLLLVLLLIGAAGTGGYLLARAHFTATIANRVLAYQSRLARAQRDAKHAQKEVERLSEDLERSRIRAQRYETALFEGPVEKVSLEESAQAYVQHVQGSDEAEIDDADWDAEAEALEERRGAELLVRNIA